MLRRFKIFLVFSLFFSVAHATVLVNAPEPYPQYKMRDSSIVIDYAGNASGTLTNGQLNATKGYRDFINTNITSVANRIFVDVSSDTTFTSTGKVIGVSLVNASSNEEIPLTGAEVVSGTSTPGDCSVTGICFSDGKAAIYSEKTTLRLSFNLRDLCATASGDLCSHYTTMNNVRYTQSIKVHFGVVDSASVASSTITTVTGAGLSDSLPSFTLGISDIAPRMSVTTCPSNFYFPGDSQIYFFTNLFSASAGTGNSVSGADVQYLIAMGREGGVLAAENGGLAANSIVSYAEYGQNQKTIEGFINTTTGSDHQYDMIVQPQNRAGIIAFTANSSSGATCNGVQSQDISGILKESKCFIATAAYHDGRAAPVMMLRKFRDQILSKFSLGQNFIQTYYQYSPSLAEWAWDKPIIRSFALKLLAPIELMAWTILKFSEAEEVPVAPSAENESYIDRLKKSLSTENEAASTGSYSEQEKKKLEASESASPSANEPYIDRMKKRLAEEKNTETSPEQYSEKEKQKLPPEKERESPIKVVKEGRDHHLDLGEMSDIKNAAGIKFGVTPGMQVTVAGGVHTFTDVYGSGFQPELLLHYEHQLFHSENFGSFGLGVDTGMAYSGGKGLLQFGFNGSSASRTGFSFIQVPLTFSGIYRFNLMRVIRPYISAGAGAIFYTETREDAKKDRRGYSAVYNGSLGVSVLMDFLDKSTRRDSYLSNGIQHTYLFLEYLYLNTFKSNVAFKRAGIYSGFLFEF